MRDDSTLIATSYLQHLTDEDLRLLASSGADKLGSDPASAVRARPTLVLDLLAARGVSELVLPAESTEGALWPASPFLIFAVAVHETRAQLERSSYVTEWLGPRRRTPVFDVEGLRDFLASERRRLFLCELLGSFTHVSSGSVLVPTRRGLRRRRFSSLDPVRLAELLEFVSEAERPGVLRQLGDLALFLTGVFPDHTATHGLSGPDEARLLRSVRVTAPRAEVRATIPGFGDASAVELLERLGRRWYQLAFESLPRPQPANLLVLGELQQRFGHARKILNVLTDRYLFPFRQHWFGVSQN
jgi:hypothetical protein